MISMEEVQQKTESIQKDMVELRRHFHKFPEISNKEVKTAALLLEKMEAIGLEVKSGLAGTGLTGLLRGGHPGKTIGIRAEMDALPIQDKKETPYRSGIPGVMHACGHDLHMAATLGTAQILSEYKEQLHGNVKFIFQPSEEKISGAERMISAGILQDPDVSAIFGFHAFPPLPTGVIGIKYGVMMASADRFSIHIYGKSGHAAKPHLGVDAILIASMVINAIHHIISRSIDPVHPAVVSIGMIRGGSAENIISDHVEMRGTIRAVSEEVREPIAHKIDDIARGITEGMGGRYRFNLERGSPPLDNHPGITRLVELSAEEIIGADRVIRLEEPSMGGEDFSYYIEHVPGSYFRLGTGSEEKDTCHYLHSDFFDVDEDAIKEAVKVLCWSTIQYLNHSQSEEF
jgi:amidohydrolase